MKRVAFIVNGLLAINYASTTPSYTPGCNYAGEFAINIPIDACVQYERYFFDAVCSTKSYFGMKRFEIDLSSSTLRSSIGVKAGIYHLNIF